MSIISYFSAWAGIIGGIWLLFSKAEDLVKPEIKTDISNWLRNLNLEGKLANWPTAFVAVFDGIFGKKHFSWRCFSRSCIASILAVLMLTIFWWALNPEVFYAYFLNEDFTETLGMYIFISFVFNLIPDYFSLFETRYIIGKLRNVNSTTKIIVFLVIDIVATAFIFFAGVAISIFIVNRIAGDPMYMYLDTLLGVVEMIEAGLTMSTFADKVPNMGVWFYSTFFTSVWIYLYVISGMIVKAGSFIGILASCIRKIFDIDNKPLRSMGYVCIAFVSLIFLIVPFAKLLF